MKGIRILVAEDEDKLREIVLKYLKKEGYDGFGAADGEEALDLWAEKQPDCIILDVTMPKMDGFEVLEEIRETDNVPVIMLTARREEEDKIQGFEVGADDYVTKPFSPRELMVRIKALLKRSGVATTENKLDVCGMVVNSDERQITINNEIINLTQKEYEVLSYFINHHKLVLTREQILDRIWGYDYDGDIRVVDTTIKRLRKKMGEKGECIQTVRGMGYKFKE
ncbi:response regulator transcription factor [Acetobacterium sp.]|uniref:response regulator transcription factor n=1 Tax=Acetobacterium sp. TaxID=1872094 RepID=UPI000CB5691B|nr:response regulator transcription factor [Acetobacterium sp.]MDO9491402.1 response regulator transcription factor [Acetobacterium sp.]PKM72668.1 MAG: DNA-binding response regulator [Firmicutes bacterium HGW-Firmicutes-17]